MNATTLSDLRSAINRAYLTDAPASFDKLYEYLQDYDAVSICASAKQLVLSVRKNKNRQKATEAFLHEYQLNSREGILLMSIAEALLRIPDAQTQDLFLQEKLSSGDWADHIQQSDSFLVNLSTLGLSLTHKIEAYLGENDPEWLPGLDSLITRIGTPVIRTAIRQAMQLLAWQFVIAESIEQALERGGQYPLYRYSFDMLGEAAITLADADRYFQSYLNAIASLAAYSTGDIYQNPGISIKLSALYPRYEPLQQQRAVKALTKKLLYLAKRARLAGITITIDAEEAQRLDMSLDIFAAVFSNPDLQDWPGLGLAVQAYQKRALPVIHWLAALASQYRRKIPLRLVKGAYWDSEIKTAQENGLNNYPVFTHKTATDVSYLACAQLILSNREQFYPQFATHNAHTLAAVYELGKQHPGFEFQRLHGMGERLYAEIIARQNWQIPCRVYAPVGRYRDLLPYLVRRLLENGTNTSFINQIENPSIAIDRVIKDPVNTLQNMESAHATSIALPPDLYGKQRLNSTGLNLADPELRGELQQNLDNLAELEWQANPLINGEAIAGQPNLIVNPYDHRLVVGHMVNASPENIEAAIAGAAEAFPDWQQSPVANRVQALRQAADLLEKHRLELVSICIREGGRTLMDALAEVREAVDFCRYYACCASELFKQPETLPGPTGERNLLYQYGRGVFVCISPWNFPIAIFIGQVTAALAAGNTVIAKPAGQTPLTAMLCIQILHQAGIPKNVLHFLPGEGALIGKYLIPDARIAGVAFTGSIATARHINQQLAQQHLDIIPLIAETGGQNIMIADSSALPEQVVQDALQSAFNSAGQRCSALRVLFLQQEVADKIIGMLIGAMQELCIGNPGNYATDIGPVINQNAAKQLSAHLDSIRQPDKVLYQILLDSNLKHGSFFSPCIVELSSIEQLQKEIFGPVLHVIRYDAQHLGQVVESVNATGYGLTLGIHSRIEARIRTIQQRAKVGNIYVNRNIIGAVVGVQPFGGMGLSGTGPKAGGPGYLRRFAVEQTVTTNTAAIGGNASLLAQDLT